MINGRDTPSTTKEEEEEDPSVPPSSETLVERTIVSETSSSSQINNDDNTEPRNLGSLNPEEDELNLKSSDALARGISSMLGNVIRDFDSKAENAVKSQDHLSFSIDRLTGELDQLLEHAPLPFIMQNASKLSNVRKRVLSLNSLLKSIQRRIDNMDRMLSTGISHEKAIAESSGQP